MCSPSRCRGPSAYSCCWSVSETPHPRLWIEESSCTQLNVLVLTLGCLAHFELVSVERETEIQFSLPCGDGLRLVFPPVCVLVPLLESGHCSFGGVISGSYFAALWVVLCASAQLVPCLPESCSLSFTCWHLSGIALTSALFWLRRAFVLPCGF